MTSFKVSLKFILLAFVLLGIHRTVDAQLQGYKKGFRFSGSLNGGGEVYSVSGIENRLAPWAYYVSGGLNLGFSGFDIPIRFAYRDRQFAFDYSFNRLSIQPRYKWARLLIGTSSISFSPYTLNGRAFEGFGVELTPGPLYFAAIKGTILNPFAIRDTLTAGNSLIPIYDREMIGAKIGLRSGSKKIELIALKVEDDRSSFDLPDTYAQFGDLFLTPKENVNLGFNGAYNFGRFVSFYFNTAASVFTGDVDDPITDQIAGDIPQQITDIQTINTTSRFALAGDAGINLNIKTLRLGFKYRRVEPFYTTMATDYFLNDIQQYTFIFSNGFFGNKLRLDANLGLEGNNLGGYRLSTTNRVIGSGSLYIQPSQNFYTVLSYSNYQTEAESRVLNLNDTLRFVTVTSQYGITSGVTFGDEQLAYRLSGSAFMQTIEDRSEVQQLGNLDALTGTISLAVEMKDYNMTISPSIFYNKYTNPETQQERYGMGLRLSKAFFNQRLRSNLSGNFSLNDYDQRNDGHVGYFTITNTFKTTQRSSISLIFSYRTTESIIRNTFDETRAQIRYGITI